MSNSRKPFKFVSRFVVARRDIAVMVENVGDDPVDRKSSFIDYFVEIKPPKVKASVKVEAPMIVEALHVNSVVSNLRDNKVDTIQFFSSQDIWKDKDESLGWVC
ncbi:hypothetical protein MTR_4g009220 [Medicago truncatula]|uniref:Uncharacterized protein n=1 Tax=Medicago truncatula TaxID=3880 RepID=G7JFP3_MEDTR|nr:hypothetical protein MTR_4g009220 [Medicago truncatula]